MQEGSHNFLSTSQIVTKIGGDVSHVKIALEPRPHAQENSESPAIFIFVCRSWCTGEGEFEQFSEFLAGKSCSKLKSKQGGFFRLALAVRTKKFRWKNSYRVKSYSTFTAHVWDICSMAGQGGARELRIAGNEPAGTFCDFHTSSLTKLGIFK